MRALQADRGAAAVTRFPRSGIVLLLTAAVAVVLDQSTKILAVRVLAPGESVPVVQGVLHWTLQRNPGAAFSLFRSVPVLFTVLAFGVTAAILFVTPRERSTPSAIAFGVVLGGAVGNLADRVFRSPGPFRGHVVDFIDFRVWPTFNVADIAVVCGAVLIALVSLREDRAAKPS